MWFEYCKKEKEKGKIYFNNIVNKKQHLCNDLETKDMADVLECLFPLTYEHVNAAISLKEMVHEHLFVNFVPHKDKHRTEVMIKIVRDWLENNKISDIVTTNPDIILDIAVMGATEFDEEFLKKMKLKGDGINVSWFDGLLEDKSNEMIVLPKKEGCMMKNIDSFIKLHGSISMLRKNSIDKDQKYSWLRKYRWYPGISSGYVEYDGNYIREVIPPISGKTINGKSISSIEPYRTLYENAENILKYTKKIIFYGFGFSEHDAAVNDKINKYTSGVKDISVIDTKCDDYKFRECVSDILKREIKDIKFWEPSKYGIS